MITRESEEMLLRCERRSRRVDHREQLEIEPRELRTLRRQHIAIERVGVDLPAGGRSNERRHEEDDFSSSATRCRSNPVHHASRWCVFASSDVRPELFGCTRIVTGLPSSRCAPHRVTRRGRRVRDTRAPLGGKLAHAHAYGPTKAAAVRHGNANEKRDGEEDLPQHGAGLRVECARLLYEGARSQSFGPIPGRRAHHPEPRHDGYVRSMADESESRRAGWSAPRTSKERNAVQRSVTKLLDLLAPGTRDTRADRAPGTDRALSHAVRVRTAGPDRRAERYVVFLLPLRIWTSASCTSSSGAAASRAAAAASRVKARP